MNKKPSKLAIVPVLVLALLLVPIGASIVSLVGTALNSQNNAFAAVLSSPGFYKSASLSFWIGLSTALIALSIVMLFVASSINRPGFSIVSILMKPVLAVPHAAAGFGLLFLIAPSGFLVRLVSPEISGFFRPPDWLIVNDPAGLSLGLGLVLKEIPFLFFVTMAALPQTDFRRTQIAQNIGYGQIWSWFISVFPSVYLQIRLPIFAVIAFATSTVDVALILGPVAPPTLSVRILGWMYDPNLTLRATAAAGAILQVGITLLAVLIWWLGEHVIMRLGRVIAMGGWRFKRDHLLRGLASVFMGASVLTVSLGLVLLLVWSFAGVWRFPDAVPQIWTTKSWSAQGANLLETGWRATIIGLSAASLSLALVLASLENEYRGNIRVTRLAWWTIYIPLLVPQIAFIGGLSVMFLRFNIDGTLWAVILVHMIFTYPYIYLTLADPWNAFDTRYLSVARTLGKGVDRAFWTIRLPILLRPILAAFALGFAVSIAQYLPTLLIGAGRQPTITTEAIALASGGNRRVIGAYALVQTMLPFMLFALASLLPNLLWKNRRALQVSRIT